MADQSAFGITSAIMALLGFALLALHQIYRKAFLT